MASVDVVLEGPITDPLLSEKLRARFMFLMAALLETEALPRMRAGIPVRTGNLRRSLRFTYIASGSHGQCRIHRGGFLLAVSPNDAALPGDGLLFHGPQERATHLESGHS